MAKYQNTHKIIQWNCRGYKANYNELRHLDSNQKEGCVCEERTLRRSQTGKAQLLELQSL